MVPREVLREKIFPKNIKNLLFRPLYVCMKHFPLLSDLFFGADTALCFKAAPEKIMRHYYFRTGQLCAVSILNLGRGPECLHPIIVRAIFDQPNADHELEYIDDAEFNYKLEEIENKNYNA